MYVTLAVGSAALIERNAENAAVPPPINKYGTSAGILVELDGFLSIFCLPVLTSISKNKKN